MTNAQNDNPSDSQSAAFGLAPCSARLAFEHWITLPPMEKDIARNSTDETKSAWPGQYRAYDVQLAWEAWCEALGIDPFAGWRPIETIPQDGSRVLVIDDQGNVAVRNQPRGYALGEWSRNDGGRGWCGHATSYPYRLTHWHTLPPLPNIGHEPRPGGSA